MLNLVDYDIHTSITFQSLPRFDSVHFHGYVADRIQKFEVVRDGQESTLFTTTVIRDDEKFLWQSCYDLIDRSIKVTTSKAEGVYGFDLLSFDLRGGLDTYKSEELSAVLVKICGKLRVGAEDVIKNSHCFGIIKKLSEEDWGKIIFKSAVDYFNLQPNKFDLIVKKLSYYPIADDHHRIIVVNDLSTEPILDQRDEEQRVRLSKSFGEQLNLFEDVPEVYINDRKNFTELTDVIKS